MEIGRRTNQRQLPGLTANHPGQSKSLGSFDLGISKDILDKKGTLTLSMRDFFNPYRYRYELFGDDFFSIVSDRRRARQARG